MAVGGSATRTYDLTTETFTTLYTGDILNAPYSGDKISITLPAGSYKLECWGAQGGNAYGQNTSVLETGAKGGYSTGTIALASDTLLYLYTGGQGSSFTYGSVTGGGFNGGGDAGTYASATSTTFNAGGGGGASDIRIGTDGYPYRVIVAGGGGGCSNGSSNAGRYAGVGGGTNGGDCSLNGSYSNAYRLATGATQTSGGVYGYFGSGEGYSSSSQDGAFGVGGSGTSGNCPFGGGGGGWYGGAASGWGPGSGGSGYVHNGTNSASSLGSNYILTDASTTAGDTAFTSPTGTSETGHSGNGYVRITVLSTSGGGGGETRIYDLSQSLVALTNLIPDGDMELSSWSGGVYDTTTKKYGSRSQHFTASGTQVQSISIPTLPVVGHKYYGRHYLKTNGDVTADDCRFEWYAGDGAGLNYVFGYNRGDHPDWEMESSILEVTAVNGSSYICRSFTVNASSDVWADGLMIIDLTAAFGAGNEPTQEWCDAHIPFFVGTTYLPTNLPETFKIGDVLNVPYTGHRISMMLPKKNLKFECWGAQGSWGYQNTFYGGRGGYSVGTLKTQNPEEAHIYSGGQGSTSKLDAGGGFNGGGNHGTSSSSTATDISGGGGGASDIRIGTDGYAYRIIVAGGGGGNGIGTSSQKYTPGVGGGTSGSDALQGTTSYPNRCAKGGTQTAGGAIGTENTTGATAGSFGVGGHGGNGGGGGAGGGGGWYGGGGGSYGGNMGGAAGGGSGYVHQGTNSASLLSQNYILLNALTRSGNGSFTSPVGTTETGHEGDGYVRITIVSSRQQEYNVGDVFDFDYAGSVQTKTLPKGKYKLEVWGAQGGNYSTSVSGGRGGYSCGTLELASETNIYIYAGGQGSSSSITGGFNGGGAGRTSGRGGGGASDIRLISDSLYSRVIVAGGGGGAGVSSSANGKGAGGGTKGEEGYTGGTVQTGTNRSGGGGQETAGGNPWSISTADFKGTFGQGGSATSGYSTGGGGAGWYGGASGYDNDSDSDGRNGGGGSGYVYTSSTDSNYPSGCLLNSSYYLTDAQTKIGNTSFVDPNGSTVTGHSGNGFVRITILEVEPQSNFNFRVRVNGDWKETIMGFVKVSGEWKEIIMAFNKLESLWYPYNKEKIINFIGLQTPLTLTGTDSTLETTQVLDMQVPIIKDHVYYFGCDINQSSLSASVDFYCPIAEPVFATGLKASEAGVWEHIGAVNVRTDWDSGTYPARIDNNNSNSTTSIQYKNFIFVDLTEAFGDGNEPDVNWCNKYIKFNSGECIIPQLDDNTFYYTGTYLNSSYEVEFTKHYLNHGETTTWSDFINSEYNSLSYNDYVFSINDSGSVVILIANSPYPVIHNSLEFFSNTVKSTDIISNRFVCIINYQPMEFESRALNLSSNRRDSAASSVGDYALFAGGCSYDISSYYSSVDAFNSSLVRSNPTALGTSRYYLRGANNPNYAVFAGGANTYASNAVDGYNSSLSRTVGTSLSNSKASHDGGSIGNYAVFAGGATTASKYAEVEAYNTSMSKSTATKLTVARQALAASSNSSYLLFAGSYPEDDGSTAVEAYSSSLTQTIPQQLPTGSVPTSCSSEEHAIFTLSPAVAYNKSLTQIIVSSLNGRGPQNHSSIGRYSVWNTSYSTANVIDVVSLTQIYSLNLTPINCGTMYSTVAGNHIFVGGGSASETDHSTVTVYKYVSPE